MRAGSPGRAPREQAERFDALRSWRKELAKARGIEPDIIIGKDTLAAVAEANPSDSKSLRAVEAIDDWELERYGDALLKALRSV